jgi:hypothetical protein
MSASSIAVEASKTTEISFTLSSLIYDISATNNEYLIMELQGSNPWPTSLISGISITDTLAEIDCLCYTVSSTALTGVKCFSRY